MSSKEPTVLGLICARGGSKRVPRKNLRPLGGKPLIAHTIQTALQCRYVSPLIVSTEDEEIAKVAKRWGADVPFMRPAPLAADDSAEWLSWQHALIQMERILEKRIDYLIGLPTTSPFRSTEDIDGCFQKLIHSDADAVITLCEADRNPYFNMVTLQDSWLKIAIPSAKRVVRTQEAPTVYGITTVAYACRRDFVLNSESLFDGKIQGVLVPKERALDIDTEIDLKFAEFLIQNQELVSPPVRRALKTD